MDLETFKRFLNEKKFRFTEQRLAVLKVIVQGKDRHPSALEIYEAVKAEHPGIGIATVYKTLRLLEREGVLYRMVLLDKTTRYEVTDSRPARCHLVCSKCGKVTEAQESRVRRALELLQGDSRFTIRQGDLNCYGICAECLPAEEKQNASKA